MEYIFYWGASQINMVEADVGTLQAARFGVTVSGEFHSTKVA